MKGGVHVSFREGYLSQLVGGSAVVDETGGRRTVGKVVDFLVKNPDDAFPRIDGFIIKTAAGQRYAPVASVIAIENDGIVRLTHAPRNANHSVACA